MGHVGLDVGEMRNK